MAYRLDNKDKEQGQQIQMTPLRPVLSSCRNVCACISVGCCGGEWVDGQSGQLEGGAVELYFCTYTPYRANPAEVGTECQ